MSNFNAGHLRAIIALIFVITINAGFIFTERISMELYATFAASAITYYFNKADGAEGSKNVDALTITTASVNLQPAAISRPVPDGE